MALVLLPLPMLLQSSMMCVCVRACAFPDVRGLVAYWPILIFWCLHMRALIYGKMWQLKLRSDDHWNLVSASTSGPKIKLPTWPLCYHSNRLKQDLIQIGFGLSFCQGRGHLAQVVADEVALSWHEAFISSMQPGGKRPETKRNEGQVSTWWQLLPWLVVDGSACWSCAVPQNLYESENSSRQKWSQNDGRLMDIR